MRKLRTISIIVLVLFIGSAHAQQKVQFSQYMFNNLAINPAYAGADEALSLTFIQRKQWTGLDNSPGTQTFSAHSAFKKKQLGLGLNIVNDRIGVHSNLSAMTNYAYHLPVTKTSVLSFGLQAGVYNMRSDYVSLMGTDFNDPQVSNPLISQTFFDFGAGIYYRSPRVGLGLSAPGLIPQNLSVNDTLSIHLKKVNLFGLIKYRIPLSEFVDLQPCVLVKHLTGVPFSYDITLNMIYRTVLSAGLAYRKSESIDLLLKAQVTRQLEIGYAYDHPVGIIARVSNGSHEVMINYVFRSVRKNVVAPR